MMGPVERGLGWLHAAQLANGSWPDFIVAPKTEGDTWPTAYICTLLSRAIGHEQRFDFMLAQARAFVRSGARPTGGWGFSCTTPVDADSTAWGLLALLSSKEGVAEDFSAEREELRKHRHARTGGFSTYRSENLGLFPEHSGYYAPTPCVTATALLALHKLARSEDLPLIRGGMEYLSRVRNDNGAWESFWWERGIFSTAMVARLFAAVGCERQALSPTRTWLERLQNPDGSWSGNSHNDPDPLLTAAALQALLDLGVEAQAPCIKRGHTWLLDAQRDDGGWDALRNMKVPSPYAPWRPDQPYGGTIVAGHRRSFVIATAVAVLARLNQQCRRIRPRIFAFPPLRDTEFDAEVSAAADALQQHTTALPDQLRELARNSPAWSKRGDGLSQYLPFWLDKALTAGRLRTAARQMALANRFGQFFCLLQDEIVDQAADAWTASMLPADTLFFQFVRGYQSLFAAEHVFWHYFERFWYEYLDALAWEKRCCGRPHRYEQDDFTRLGRKFSPLKICCVGICLLGGRTDVLPALEELVEVLNAGYQLLDDLSDWQEDFARQHWTWPLALVREKSKGVLSIDDVERLLWSEGLARSVADLATDYLERAEHQARQLGLAELAGWIHGFRHHANSIIQSVATPSNNAGDGPLLKVIADSDGHIALNASTGALFALESDLAPVAMQIAAGGWRPTTSEQAAMVAELTGAGMLATAPAPARDPSPQLATLFIELGRETAHRCFSCHGAHQRQQGSLAGDDSSRAARAVERLLLGGTATRAVDVVFLCGSQKSAAAFVADVISANRRRTETAEKNIRYHLVADPFSPDIDAIAEVAKSGGHVHLSKDRICDHAGVDKILAAVQSIRKAAVGRLSINLGLENFQGPLANVIAELDFRELDPIGLQSRHFNMTSGHPELNIEATQRDFTVLTQQFTTALQTGRLIPLFDILYPLRLLYRRERRATHCDAGASMLTVALDGSLFPCFRFTDEQGLRIGDEGGNPDLEDLAVYRQHTVGTREPCRSCWARHLCGGGCYDDHLRANGSVLLPDPAQCALITHRFEEIMKLAARLQSRLADLDPHLDREEFVTFIANGRG